MKELPVVSVVMPAYNAGLYIEESIGSVIAQTYPYWELIVVDDGSTDDSRRKVETLAAADAGVRYIYQENGRQGKARNAGIAMARGGLVAFLDADDLWVPEMLEQQLALLDSSKGRPCFWLYPLPGSGRPLPGRNGRTRL